MAHLPGHNEAAVSEYRSDTGEFRPLYTDVMGVSLAIRSILRPRLGLSSVFGMPLPFSAIPP